MATISFWGCKICFFPISVASRSCLFCFCLLLLLSFLILHSTEVGEFIGSKGWRRELGSEESSRLNIRRRSDSEKSGMREMSRFRKRRELKIEGEKKEKILIKRLTCQLENKIREESKCTRILEVGHLSDVWEKREPQFNNSTSLAA